jgi:hypothetical protein
MADKIEVKLVRTNVFTRWPCTVCGGVTEKDEVLCESDNMAVRVCPQCLKRGDIDGHLESTAAAFERDATYLRSLIGKLKVPTYAEWEAEIARCEAEHEDWLREHQTSGAITPAKVAELAKELDEYERSVGLI